MYIIPKAFEHSGMHNDRVLQAAGTKRHHAPCLQDS